MLKRAAVTVLLPLLSLCLPGAASAQWATNDNNIHNTNTGNVGVGTTAPEQTLHVSGTEILSTGTRSGFKFRDRAGGATNNWVWYSTGNVARLHLQGIGDLMAVTPSGNVGIGTVSPNVGHKLEVAGHASAFGLSVRNPNSWTQVIAGRTADTQAAFIVTPSTAYSPSTPYWAMGFSPGGGAGWSLDTYDGTSLITRLRVMPVTGNVGVGVPAPLHKLDVGGNMTIGAGYNSAVTVPVNGLLVEGGVGIGTTTPTEKLHVVGNIHVTGNINAKYQDVSEWVPSTQSLAAGTVVALDTERANHVVASATAYDTRVAGVISAQPGLALGERGEGKVLVATTGRVKIKVNAARAPIRIGDLLVTSGAAGVAMKSEPVSFGGVSMHRPGTIIGKALEPLEKGTGEILVLLSLQ